MRTWIQRKLGVRPPGGLEIFARQEENASAPVNDKLRKKREYEQ